MLNRILILVCAATSLLLVSGPVDAAAPAEPTPTPKQGDGDKGAAKTPPAGEPNPTSKRPPEVDRIPPDVPDNLEGDNGHHEGDADPHVPGDDDTLDKGTGKLGTPTVDPEQPGTDTPDPPDVRPARALRKNGKRRVGKYEPLMLRNGLVLPYPLDNLFRGFARCRRGAHTHRALDIGGVGKNWGVGTPVRAIAKMRIIAIGTPETSEAKYGKRLKSNGTTKRGSTKLPCSKHIGGYGKVYFFTRNYGKYRSGVIVSAILLEGKLKRHKVRYMHLAAVHPSLKKGKVVKAGQEIGLMGGTAVQDDPPHVHFEIITPGGKKKDVGPLLGIGSTYASCRGGHSARWEQRKRYSKRARKLMAKLRREAARYPPLLEDDGARARAMAKARGKKPKAKRPCPEIETIPMKFKSRWTIGKLWTLKGTGRKPRKKERMTLRVHAKGGDWRPRVEVLNAKKRPLFAGNWASKKDRRKYKFSVKNNGKAGGLVELEFQPQKDDLIIRTTAWQKKSKKRKKGDRRVWLPKKARFVVEMERPCRR